MLLKLAQYFLNFVKAFTRRKVESDSEAYCVLIVSYDNELDSIACLLSKALTITLVSDCRNLFCEGKKWKITNRFYEAFLGPVLEVLIQNITGSPPGETAGNVLKCIKMIKKCLYGSKQTLTLVLLKRNFCNVFPVICRYINRS